MLRTDQSKLHPLEQLGWVCTDDSLLHCSLYAGFIPHHTRYLHQVRMGIKLETNQIKNRTFLCWTWHAQGSDRNHSPDLLPPAPLLDGSTCGLSKRITNHPDLRQSNVHHFGCQPDRRNLSPAYSWTKKLRVLEWNHHYVGAIQHDLLLTVCAWPHSKVQDGFHVLLLSRIPSTNQFEPHLLW